MTSVQIINDADRRITRRLDALDEMLAKERAASAAAPLPLGEQLVASGLITPEELKTALASHVERGLRLGEILIELGFTSEEDLLPIMSQRLGLPAVALREGTIDPVALKCVRRHVAESLDVLALFKVRDTLTVAMAEPDDLQHIDELERITRLKVRPVFAFASSIQKMIARCYEDGFEVDSVTADMDESAVQLNTLDADIDMASIEGLVEGSPIINLGNYLLVQAIRTGASDIHIEPGRKFTSVRYRVDGQLREAVRPRQDVHPALISRIKVMGRMNIAEHHTPQDGRFQVTVDGREVDIRVSTLPTVLGEKVVMRILDRDRLTFNLDVLGIPHDMLDTVKQLVAKPYGLVLVTGPTGSGKTTTLYSALELIKSVHRNIVTIEDPVEYQIELVNQVQIANSRDVTFAAALRSILRQDPDVIMLGEIRDAETAELAVQAALTGHLVLSTLHTNDTAGAITRLVDMGVDGFKIAASLVGIIAQRLVRTVCPECRTFYYPPAELLEMLHYDGDRQRSFVRGEGCPKCFDTGHQGRVGIYEVMPVDRDIRELVAQSASIDAIRDCHRKRGGRTLLQEGLRVAEAEKTSLDEIMRVAYVE